MNNDDNSDSVINRNIVDCTLDRRKVSISWIFINCNDHLRTFAAGIKINQFQELLFPGFRFCPRHIFNWFAVAKNPNIAWIHEK